MASRNSIARLLCTVAAAAASLAIGETVAAQTRTTDPSTLDILEVLVSKGILTRDDANVVLGEARQRAEAAAADGTVRVPYVPEAVRNQIRDEVKAEVIATAKSERWAEPGTLPEWTNRISWSGDVRVRAQGDRYSSSNTPLILDVNAINADGSFTTQDVLPLRETIASRYRARVRARFGLEAQINEHVEGGIRLATGTLGEGFSTNETLTGNFDRFQVGLDRAYIRIRPFERASEMANTSLWFGKFDNPFFSTEMMFDRDLQFDGIAATIDWRFGEGDDAPRVFLTGGAFPLEEVDFTSKDKFLFAGQIGGSASVGGVRLQAAAAYYSFANVQGQYNTLGLRDNDFTAPDRVQFGNSVFNLRRDGGSINTVLFGLASKFRVAAITAKAEFVVNEKLVATVDAEAIKNLAFDRQDLIARGVPASSGDMGWHARLGIGYRDLGVRGAWDFNIGYRRIEGDATLDLFTDSDFGLGTDQQGYVARAGYGVFDNMWLQGSWFSSRTLDLVDATGALAPPVDVDTFMLDLNVRF